MARAPRRPEPTMQIRSTPAGKEANRISARCAHARGETVATWEEMEDDEGRAAVMRRLIAGVRAEEGCECGAEILRELGDE